MTLRRTDAIRGATSAANATPLLHRPGAFDWETVGDAELEDRAWCENLRTHAPPANDNALPSTSSGDRTEAA